MKKLIIYILFCLPFLASAQYNTGLIYTGFFSNDNANLLPSEVGLDMRKISIRLGSAYMYGGNSFMDANSIYTYGKYVQREGLGTDDQPFKSVGLILPSIVDKLGDKGIIGASAIINPPLGIVYKLNKSDGSERMTFSFNYRFVGGGSFVFGSTLPRTIWEGNTQYVGENVNIGPFEAQSHIYSEIGGGVAVPLVDIGPLTNVRLGMNFKYLVGYGVLYTKTGDIWMNTAADGRSIDFELDYDVSIAGLMGLAYKEASDTLNEFSYDIDDIRNATGRGFGVDIGITMDVLENLRVSAAINDIGAISYSDNVYNFRINKTVTWDGLPVDFFNNDSAAYDLDTVFNSDAITESSDDFNVPLAQRLVLNARMGFGENETSKGLKYFTHSFYGTFIQGFNNQANNSTRSFINVGYTYNIKNILTLGANGGIGGISRYNLGMFAGLKAGPFRMALGSNSLLGLVTPTVIRGADLSLNMSLTW